MKGRGHLDEVQALRLKSATASQNGDADVLVLTEGAVLGGGAFSRVSIVTGIPSPLLSQSLQSPVQNTPPGMEDLLL